mmetsp:Transcript_69053/g.184036  ORF Transcript_69053/g.184036 Transcript_69053/m.184036 type:complete len:250 (-) Transcript_69053:177-926(-)
MPPGLVRRRDHPEAVRLLHLAYVDDDLRGLPAGPVLGPVRPAAGLVGVQHLLAVTPDAGPVAGVAAALLEHADFLGGRVVAVVPRIFHEVRQRLVRVSQLQTRERCLGHVPEHQDHHLRQGGVGDLLLLADGPLLLGLLALLLGQDAGHGWEGVDLPLRHREPGDLRERLGYGVLLSLRITCIAPEITKVVVGHPLGVAPVRRRYHPVPHHHPIALNRLHGEEAPARTQHPLAGVPNLPHQRRPPPALL